MKLSEYEIQQVHSAAEILVSDLRVYITIPKLADKVRLPAKKLKAGFLQVFGVTVYSYFLNARMEKAKQMLLDDVPIRHIAKATGYKGETAESNFIKAFKKKFDETPASWIRKHLKSSGKGLLV